VQNQVVISADIIASTSLSNEDRSLLVVRLEELLGVLEADHLRYGRLIKGDYIECVLNDAKQGLRVMLLIKTFLRAFALRSSYEDKTRIRRFEQHGGRVGLGFGELSRLVPEKGIIDGEAIYYSGRLLNDQTTHDKERVSIKQTLFFNSKHDLLNQQMNAMLSLIGVVVDKATSKQNEVAFFKLKGLTEAEISKKLGKTQPVINRQSTSLGWHALDEVLMYFETVIQTYYE